METCLFDITHGITQLTWDCGKNQCAFWVTLYGQTNFKIINSHWSYKGKIYDLISVIVTGDVFTVITNFRFRTYTGSVHERLRTRYRLLCDKETFEYFSSCYISSPTNYHKVKNHSASQVICYINNITHAYWCVHHWSVYVIISHSMNLFHWHEEHVYNHNCDMNSLEHPDSIVQLHTKRVWGKQVVLLGIIVHLLCVTSGTRACFEYMTLANQTIYPRFFNDLVHYISKNAYAS